jgi:hypothetical protein
MDKKYDQGTEGFFRELEDALLRARYIDPFTPDFNRFVVATFPDDTALRQSVEGDNIHTTRLLERKRKELDRSLAASEIIQKIKGGEEEELLTLAFKASIAKTLHQRCEKNERNCGR